MKPLVIKKIEYEEFDDDDLSNHDFSRREFVRVLAEHKVFKKVNFTQCVFTSCEFRHCNFENCNFEGSSIKDSNFRGSQFGKCNFKYTRWEKTLLDEDFLKNCFPNEENLARDLARSLRTNFAQIGYYEAVNKASLVEVKKIGAELYKASFAPESWYRSTYTGLKRFKAILQYLRWKFLDLLWGNGERIFRVILTGLVVIIFVAVIFYMCDTAGVSFQGAFLESLGHFWGIQHRAQMPMAYSVPLTVSRYVLFGLFMAILVKRLSRR